MKDPKHKKTLVVLLAVFGAFFVFFGLVFIIVMLEEWAAVFPGIILLAAGAVMLWAMRVLKTVPLVGTQTEVPASAGSGTEEKPTAADCKAAYLRYMDGHDIKYRDVSDRTVEVAYDTSNAGTVRVSVVFDESAGGYVHFFTPAIGPFRDKVAEGVLLCNAMNLNYRWVTFFLDRDNDVAVDADAMVSVEDAGRVCSDIVVRMVDIVDKAYPEFMKVKWGQGD